MAYKNKKDQLTAQTRWRNKNRGQYRKLARDWYHRHQEASRKYVYKDRYGITVEMYEKKLAEQGGLCAICHQPPNPKFRITKLVVDHDHEHGRLRDLLCDKCNKVLGLANDDPTILLDAFTYLKKWKMKFMFGE